MIRQVSLAVNFENQFQKAAAAHDVVLTVVYCKPFNSTRICLLLDLSGKSIGIRQTIAGIRKVAGVRQATQGEALGDRVPLLIVMDRPPFCRASSDAAIICLQCPLNSTESWVPWRFIVRSSSDLRHVMSIMVREKLETRIEDISPLAQRPDLTARQKEIMALAVSKGYFEFPRKIGLTALSGLVGVKPSTLSEILRSAERRIMEEALGVPLAAEQWRFPD